MIIYLASMERGAAEEHLHIQMCARIKGKSTGQAVTAFMRQLLTMAAQTAGTRRGNTQPQPQVPQPAGAAGRRARARTRDAAPTCERRVHDGAREGDHA